MSEIVDPLQSDPADSKLPIQGTDHMDRRAAPSHYHNGIMQAVQDSVMQGSLDQLTHDSHFQQTAKSEMRLLPTALP